MYFCVPLKFCNKTHFVKRVSAKSTSHSSLLEKTVTLSSSALNRSVGLKILLPSIEDAKIKFPLLLLNDGQDIEKLNVRETLQHLIDQNLIRPVVVVGIVAGDRMQEYGIAARADYLKRGSKATAYNRFVVHELIPHLLMNFPIDADQPFAFAGCSMGGLSAFDVVWNNPELFNKVGAFSGSFWWRRRDSASRFYSDARDRIAHLYVRRSNFRPGLKFWFQTGTADEAGDRNKNGVIDSIDDTLDLIAELTKKGYRPFHDLQYLEIEGGQHNLETWAKAMPAFLLWAFGNTTT